MMWILRINEFSRRAQMIFDTHSFEESEHISYVYPSSKMIFLIHLNSARENSFLLTQYKQKKNIRKDIPSEVPVSVREYEWILV